ncbi:MAG TPA: YARHG domain-containing protein [Chthoniobacterales bacterium]
MNRRWIAVAIIVVAIIVFANIFILLFLMPRWSSAASNPPSSPAPVAAQAPAQTASSPPVTAAPAAVPANGAVATNKPAPVVRQHPTPPPIQPGMHLERQVVTASGNLRVRYLRDRAKGVREITLQDAHSPANETLLAQYKRNAWVVVSPNDDWVILETREKGEEAGVQLYHRVSATPLKYEVPEDLRADGSRLRDVVWQTYLDQTQQDPNIDPRRVTIDATAWGPDSEKVTLSIAPLPTKDDRAVPVAWTCLYDVKTKQVEPSPDEVAEAPADENAAPNDSVAANNDAEQAPPDQTAPGDDAAQAAPTGGDSQDLEGERFPATREQEITIENANELDADDIHYAIFEMFARHGAEIHDAKMKKVFADMPWYQPRAGFSFDDAELDFSDIEKHNIAVLRRVRDAKVAATRRSEPKRPVRGEPVEEESNGQRVLRGVLQGVSDALNGGN